MKRIISVILCICMIWTSIPNNVFASEHEETLKMDDFSDDTLSFGEIGGFLAGNIETVKKIHENKLFTTHQGHGFAAENANNLYDSYKGLKGKVVGGDFLKNGPDRKIINRNGIEVLIQDKYYRSARETVAAAFDENGIYKYVNADGMPMLLEVPKDQYDDVVKLIEDKIKDGKIRNITDPGEASKIVKQGNVTYKQAVNIAKAGNIDSLVYDAANGVVSASCAAGIGFVLDYAVSRMNGLDPGLALDNAIKSGLKTGGFVFATFVISSQLARTGVLHAFVPTSEAITKALGPEVCEAILKRTGINVTGLTTAQITTKVTEILSKELLTEAVVIVILTASDVTELFKGRISKEELLKNLTVAIVVSVAGTAGQFAGGAVGNYFLPGAGAKIGAIAGGVLIGGGAGLISELIADKIYKSDADEMFEIISAEFQNLGEEYLINEEEAAFVSEELSLLLKDDTLKDMYESEDRTEFAIDLMKPLFEKQIESRELITIPNEYQIRYQYKTLMTDVVFIH